MKGALGFSTQKRNIVSKAIRWFIGSKFSHSFVITDVNKDPYEISKEKVYLIEARQREVSFNILKYYDQPGTSYEIWMPNNISPNKISKAIHRTERIFLYQLYGYFQVIGIAVKILLSKIGINIKNPIRLGSICSEVNWYYLKQLMPETFGIMDRDTVSPADLYNIIKQSDKFRLVKSKEF